MCIIQGCAEFWNVNFGWKNSNSNASLACSGLKVKLDQLTDIRSTNNNENIFYFNKTLMINFITDTKYDSIFSHLLLGMRHWSTELLIDSAWFQIGNGETPLKKYHSWGTAFFVGVALIKWGSHLSGGTKIEAMFDCLRIEWGPNVANIIIQLIQCLNDYRRKQYKKSQTIAIKKPENKLSINVSLTNVNIFTLSEKKFCLMNRFDTVTVEKSISKFGLVISGFKVADIVPKKGHFICQRAEEMNSSNCYVKLSRWEFDKRNIKMQFLEEVDVQWSPNIHLKLMNIFKEFKLFKENFKTEMPDQVIEKKVTENKTKRSWKCTFKGDIYVRAILSQKHSLLYTTGKISMNIQYMV